MQIDIGMVGTTEAGVVLEGLAVRAAALAATAFPAIVEDFQRISAQRFAEHGPGWAPLSAVTIGLKTRRGYQDPATPMVAEGDLLFSLAGTNHYTVHEVGPDVLLMGTSAPYAQFHQEGPRQIKVFGRGKATLPQRVVVDITEATALRWSEIIQTALIRGGKRAR
jgi:phage gpG-like protein